MTTAGTLAHPLFMHEWEYAFAMLPALCKEWIVGEFRQLRPGKTPKNKG
jgi:hypothetical protein